MKERDGEKNKENVLAREEGRDSILLESVNGEEIGIKKRHLEYENIYVNRNN